MFYYKAFGFIIHSEIELNELIPYKNETPDINIKIGSVPEDFKGKDKNIQYVRISRDRYYLNISGVAEYYAEKGSLIIVNANENATLEEIKLYLLGSCMGAILFQHRILPLHGSCISMNSYGVVITGNSGAGKSTIASAFIKKGYKILTDDIIAISKNELGAIYAISSYPCQKLWGDALERNNIYENKKWLRRISENIKKYSVRDTMYFTQEAVLLKYIFEIIPSETEKLSIIEILGGKKLEIIANNTYRKKSPFLMDIKKWYFGEIVSVAKQVRVFQIVRPEHEHLENEIADIILNYIL